MSIDFCSPKETLIQFLKVCFIEKNRAKAHTLLAEDFLWTQSASEIIYHKIEDLEKFIIEKNFQPAPYKNLTFPMIQCFSISSNLFEIWGQFTLSSSEPSNTTKYCFFSSVYQKQDIYFIKNFHLFNFICSDGLSFSLEEKERKVQQHLLSLLTDSVSSTIITTHTDKKFTLSYTGTDILYFLGYTKAEFQEKSKGCFYPFLFPEDAEQIYSQIEFQLQSSSFYEIEYRLIKKDGGLLWVLEKGKKILDETGHTFYLCILFDHTKVKNLEKKLYFEKEKYQIVTALSKDFFWEFDCIHEDFPSLPLEEIEPEDKKHLQKFFQQIKEGKTKIQIEFRAKALNETTFNWFRLEGTTRKDDTIPIFFAVGKLTNIEKEKQKEIQQLKASHYDTMTDLPNKYYINQLANSLLETIPKGKNAFLFILDIDNFKIVNDKLGHLFGDTILINIAHIIKTLLPPQTIAGRIGGDEFVVLFPYSSLEEAASLAKKFCSQIRSIYAGDLTEISLSCSIGIAEFPSHGNSYQELFQKADLSLYHVKKQGKDGFKFYHKSDQYLECQRDLQHLYNMESIQEHTPILNNQVPFLQWVLNILATTKDLNSAIQIVIDKTCAQYHFDDILIGERTPDEQNIQITYNRSTFYNQGSISKNTLFPWKNAEEVNELYRQKDYISGEELDCFVKENLPVRHQKILEQNTFLEFIIRNNQEILGTLTALRHKPHPWWTQIEITVLRQVSAALTPYLIKKHMTAKSEYLVNLALNYDSLTKLPLLSYFKKKSAEILQQNPTTNYAIVYSDINNFKYINDIYGFSVGDEVLCAFASMMLHSVNKRNVCCARLTNDNFIALIPYENISDLQLHVSTCNMYINLQLRRKYPNMEIYINSGIALVKKEENSIIHAIDNANIARKSVKIQAKNTCKIFDSKLEQIIIQQAEMSSNMNYALSNHEFVVYLQPKFFIESGNLAGAEALVRWQRPQGMIYPDTFIPFFEKNGFITKLDTYVLTKVLEMLQQWQQKYQYMIPISVNLSRLHGDDPLKVKKISSLIEKFQIPPHYIEFELTETALNQDTNRLHQLMVSLMKKGYNVSIDDFGSGYSSLNAIASIPANIIKLDKDFLKTDVQKPYSQIVIKNIVKMIKEMGLTIVCEGIETAEQASFLKKIGCHIAQGYFYAKPMEISKFEKNYFLPSFQKQNLGR